MKFVNIYFRKVKLAVLWMHSEFVSKKSAIQLLIKCMKLSEKGNFILIKAYCKSIKIENISFTPIGRLHRMNSRNRYLRLSLHLARKKWIILLNGVLETVKNKLSSMHSTLDSKLVVSIRQSFLLFYH